MNRTADELTAALHRAASRAPHMSLDPVETVRLGRRRARTRRAGALGGAAVLVVAVAVGASALPDRAPTLPAAPTDPVASSAAAPQPTPDVVALAPTLRATRSPAATTSPGGTTWWLTGLSASGEHLVLGDAPVRWGTRTSVPFAAGDPGSDAGVASLELEWDAQADVRDHGPGNGYPSQASTSLGVPGDALEITMGAVPAWMPGARVALTFSYGVPDADGEVRHVVELPTFPDPSGTGAQLYAVAGDPSLPDLTGTVPRGGSVSGASWVVFVGADGSTYVNGLPVTPGQLGVWLGEGAVDEVVAELRAMGAAL
ncbi:hypothetical protein [Cellulomonas wangsupingiae]|uniref:hypothetical protein n=1 Tax=Cellulomonas wangsupingiae TaxID=2968085 RepID=UPI00202F86BE|nr:hypothetical protein [Cellulomonas wangsupingiae]MCM0641510.1 hypothetical protein [Cellulomonas wangsupingiae]